MPKFIITILLLFVVSVRPFAQNDKVFKIHFRLNSSEFDMDLMDNAVSMDSVISILNGSINGVSNLSRLESLMFFGGASPDGSVRYNQRLSERRANSLFSYIHKRVSFDNSQTSISHVGRDWKGLLSLVENDTLVPYHKGVLSLLRYVVDSVSVNPSFDPLFLVKGYKDGVPYKYMYDNLFQYLRVSKLYVKFKVDKPARVIKPTGLLPIVASAPEALVSSLPCPSVLDFSCIKFPEYVPDSAKKPFYMSIKTNMLYDAGIIPNIGLEFYLGANFSITANTNFAWWKRDKSHFYWQTYGGDAEIRYWFGRAAWDKPLTGHHVGIIGQMFTYDFELGKRGYQAPDWHWGLGAAYGYALPITKYLNIDFSIAAGYITGIFHEYIPIDGHYVWQSTKRRHYFGPTKAEVTLVWLLGNGNHNKLTKRGGVR